MKVYLDSFKYYGFDKLYNGLNKPLEGKGSGCSAFAFSFLELINAIDSTHTKEWTADVAIPDRLIGGHWTQHRVSMWQVLFTFHWAKEKNKHTHLLLYEPGHIYDWILENYQNNEKNSKIIPVKLKNAHGVEVDCIQECKPKQVNYFKDYSH